MATMILYGSEKVATQKLYNALSKEKHAVTVCSPGDSIPWEMDKPPLVILDAQLKWSVCRPLLAQFQQQSAPILFVTADRQMVSHLRALYSGPSDVLTLPFSQRALQEKLNGLLGSDKPLRELTVDEKERVALLDGERVELTAQEFALLLALMESPDMPISREQLLRKAWGYQSMGETRTVDVHVQRLRKKLGDERIETVYKCGYRIKMA